MTSETSADLHSVLTVDPENQDVKSIIQSQHLRPEMVGIIVPDNGGRLFIANIASQRA